MTTKINNEHKKVYAPNSTDRGNVIRNVPHLRFPEFEGEWEKCPLGKISTKITKKNKGNTIQNVLCNSATLGLIPQNDYFDREIANSNNTEGYYVIEYGDFVYNPRKSVSAPYGPVNIYTGSIKGIISPLYLCFSVHSIMPSFLYYRFKSSVWFPYVYSHGDTGTRFDRVSIKDDIFFEMPIYMPSSKEQIKIANLMALLDERIATQNKIIDKLQSLIKGMEDNLLDNPLWEKTYLRSFMQFFPTNSLSWEQLSYKEGAIRNLHYGLIHGFQTRGINSASLPMIKNEAIPKQYTLCQVGDVAFADASEDTGEIAKSVEFVDTIEGDTICGLHTIHGRDIKNETVVGFKGFAFNSRYFHNQIKRLAQGTKVFSITANNLSSCYVYLPDLETQKAIVKLLKAYEAQLIVSRKTLKQYENQKQYLLRQMFI